MPPPPSTAAIARTAFDDSLRFINFKDPNSVKKALGPVYKRQYYAGKNQVESSYEYLSDRKKMFDQGVRMIDNPKDVENAISAAENALLKEVIAEMDHQRRDGGGKYNIGLLDDELRNKAISGGYGVQDARQFMSKWGIVITACLVTLAVALLVLHQHEKKHATLWLVSSITTAVIATGVGVATALSK